MAGAEAKRVPVRPNRAMGLSTILVVCGNDLACITALEGVKSAGAFEIGKG